MKGADRKISEQYAAFIVPTHIGRWGSHLPTHRPPCPRWEIIGARNRVWIYSALVCFVERHLVLSQLNSRFSDHQCGVCSLSGSVLLGIDPETRILLNSGYAATTVLTPDTTFPVNNECTTKPHGAESCLGS